MSVEVHSSCALFLMPLAVIWRTKGVGLWRKKSVRPFLALNLALPRDVRNRTSEVIILQQRSKSSRPPSSNHSSFLAEVAAVDGAAFGPHYDAVV